jgi:3-hydroxybutyryl-CoA dehydratase
VTEVIRKAAPLPLVGASAQRTRTFADDAVALFALASGDENPIHLDEDYASRSPFRRRIAHGMLTASLISAVLGNDLPGHGSIYLSQTLRFVAPVFIGDTITARVEVVATREDKRLVTLRTECFNQDGAVVLTGEALVKYPGE